jgi:Ca2+-binding RTX toxin-like protein
VTGSNTDNQILGAQGADSLAGLGGNDYLRGADGGDTLSGGAGSDLIDGGFGVDTLTGGADADIFLFSRTIDAGDTITDFEVGLDRIFLDHAGFGLGAAGTLAQAGVAFQLGTSATGNAPALVYDPATGALLWDADGAGAGAAIVLAQLTGHPSLGASSFAVA